MNTSDKIYISDLLYKGKPICISELNVLISETQLLNSRFPDRLESILSELSDYVHFLNTILDDGDFTSDEMGYALIHMIYTVKHRMAVHLALKPSTNVNFMNSAALMTACVNGCLPVVEALLSRSDLIVDSDCIENAINMGHYDIAREVLKDSRANPSVNESRLLLRLSMCGNSTIDILETVLLDKRVDPSVFNNTILESAIVSNRTKIIDLLLKHPKTVNLKNDNSKVIKLAEDNQYPAIVKLFKDALFRQECAEYIDQKNGYYSTRVISYNGDEENIPHIDASEIASCTGDDKITIPARVIISEEPEDDMPSLITGNKIVGSYPQAFIINEDGNIICSPHSQKFTMPTDEITKPVRAVTLEESEDDKIAGSYSQAFIISDMAENLRSMNKEFVTREEVLNEQFNDSYENCFDDYF